MAVRRAPGTPDPSPLAGVSLPHPAHTAARRRWQMIADVLEGSDAVKYGGYLPQLAGHKDRKDLASAYRERAVFVNFSERTLQAMVGAIFRKEGGVKVPSKYEPRLSNINNAGDQLYNFAKKVTREVIAFGRFGILVDAGSSDSDDPLDRLPYMAGYAAQYIINWRTTIVYGKPVLNQVVLLEDHEEPVEFGSVSRPRYRVLELDESGFYRIRVIDNYNDTWSVIEEVYPTDSRRRKLSYIPFIFVGPYDLSPNVSKSPIADLVDVNLSHYRTSADLEQGRFFTSQPTPIISGVNEADQENYADMSIGSGNVWLLPPATTASLLEFKGDGLGSLERALAEKERQMAQLGARLLAEPKRTAEAAETVRLRHTSETSTLASIARTVADGIKTAMETSCQWAGIDTTKDKIEFELNQDFIDNTMEPTMLAQLIGAWQAGAMPLADLYWNLQRGEMVRPGSTLESYQGDLDSEGPHLGAPTTYRLLDGIPERDEEGE